MPRAEVGSTKHIANQMKSKGLQRLRWYCQACSRQMRDENGFKCHVASESHVRNMLVIGEDPRRAINEFSSQFQRDFIQLLRTGHGEKKINVNHFYQEYIGNKQHVHMNATKWASLTEFAKYLGREGICRVEQDEKDDGRGGAGGLTISWIDNSPENLRRQDALRKKDRQDRGDEERELRAIEAQIRRARKDEGLESAGEDDGDDSTSEGGVSLEVHEEGIKRKDGEKIILSFGTKKQQQQQQQQQQQPDTEKPPSPPLTEPSEPSNHEDNATSTTITTDLIPKTASPPLSQNSSQHTIAAAAAPKTTSLKPISFGSASNKPKNVFAAASKKNAFGGSGAKKPAPSQQKPMSEAERIMKEELERKRLRDESRNNNGAGGTGLKRQRVS